MSDDYDKYERACKRIRKDNAKLLYGFDQWLSAKGLSEKTIEQHVRNVDFYIDAFLLYSDAVPAKEGTSEVWSFFGNWFIRKTLWASQNSMRQIGVSLKRFYTFMHEQGQIDADALADLKETVKEEMPNWLALLRQHDDVDSTDPLARWGR
jgi:site-specific recombinase XerD